jgi:predicted dehydrogenase
MSTQKSTVRTAVVGCGYWGKNLVRTFERISDLRVCCDASQDVRARMAAAYPAVRVTADYGAILADPDIDAVVLATPAASHAVMATAALRAGKHTFVEKPLALNVADAESLVRLSQETDRILAVGHLLEYHPAVEYVKAMLDRGEFGEIYYLYSRRVNLGKVRSEENALWSLAPHDISVILYLLGEEPNEVTASGHAFLQPGIEDVVFLTLRFPSGRAAHVHVSWLDPHRERSLTVVGSQRMVVFNDADANEKIRVYDKGVDRPSSEATNYESYAELFLLRDGDIVIPRLPPREPLAVECEAFLHAIQAGVPPRADGADGLAVVRVLAAAQESIDAAQPILPTGAVYG